MSKIVSTANLLAVEIDPAEVPKINDEEVLQLAKKIVENKANSLNNIPNKALKTSVEIVPNMFAEAFTTCVRGGVFPIQWKKQRLRLVPKRNKPLGELLPYRPICLSP